MIKLSGRLKTAADFIRKGSVIADIGCDHGYLSIYALQAGLAEKCYCLDINKGPLERAEQNMKKAGLVDKAQFILSDGFEKLSCGLADTAVILGMGGGLIQNIIRKAPQNVISGIDRFILGPQSEVADFRKFLYENGFKTEDEKLIFDEGKYYFILSVCKGREDKPCEDFELSYGRVEHIRGNRYILPLIGKDLNELEGILSHADGLPAERRDELVKKREMLMRAGSAYEI